jgi:ATP/maltotriose-dependent transcriptional regulator MalT
MCLPLGILADVARRQGAFVRARELYEEALPLARVVGDIWGIATIRAKLAIVASEQGRHAVASQALEASLEAMRELGDREGAAWVLSLMGQAARGRGDRAEARRTYEQSLALFEELEAKWGLAEALEGLAWTTSDEGRAETATRLLGQVETIRNTCGIRRLSHEATVFDAAVERLQAELGESRFASAWAEGAAMTIEHALAEARESVTVKSRRDQVVDKCRDRLQILPLTKREREVALLIARGMTNRDIAAQLAIADSTAERHVANIRGKLGYSSRAQVAVWVVERGLLSPERCQQAAQ